LSGGTLDRLLICTVAVIRILIDIQPIGWWMPPFRSVAVILTILGQPPSVIKETGWETIINIHLIFIDPLFLLKRNGADATPRQKHGCK